MGTSVEKRRIKKPAYAEKPLVLFGHRLSWHHYFKKKTLDDHCRFSDKQLSAHLMAAARILADHCRTNRREAFMVTVIFYRAETIEETYRQAFELLDKAELKLQEEGGDLFLGGMEIHRVLEVRSRDKKRKTGFSDMEEGGDSGEEQDEGADSSGEESEEPLISTGGQITTGGGRKTRTVATRIQQARGMYSETTHEARMVRERKLVGRAHLHLLLVLDQNCYGQLHEFFSSQKDRFLDVLVRTVGGGSLVIGDYKPQLDGDKYRKAMDRALRYVLKEQNVERREQLFLKLDQLQGGNGRYAKYRLTYNRAVAEMEGLLLPQLECIAGHLTSLKMDYFNNDRPFFPVGCGNHRRVSTLVRHYLESTDSYVLYHRQTPGNKEDRYEPWRVALLRPVPLPLQLGNTTSEYLTVNTEEVFGQICEYYQNRGWTDLREMLSDLKSSFSNLVSTKGLELPRERVVGKRSQFYSLLDGTTLWWNQKRVFYQSWQAVAERRARMAKQRGASSREVENLWTDLTLGTSWFALMRRVRDKNHLRELRRFLHHPDMNYLENTLRLVNFLQWLGRARVEERKDQLGLFIYGNPGVGKSPFLKMVAESLFGPKSYRSLRSDSLVNGFGLEGSEEVDALLLDEMEPYRWKLQQRLREVMSSTAHTVDRKHKTAQEVEFNRKLLLVASNHGPREVFGDLWKELDKRFSLRLEIFHKPRDGGGGPDSYGVDELREEMMGEAVVFGMLFSQLYLEENLRQTAETKETVVGVVGNNKKNWVERGHQALRLLMNPPFLMVGFRPESYEADLKLIQESLKDSDRWEMEALSENKLSHHFSRQTELTVTVEGDYHAWDRKLWKKDPVLGKISQEEYFRKSVVVDMYSEEEEEKGKDQQNNPPRVANNDEKTTKSKD